MHNLSIKRNVQHQNSLSLFSCSFLWHAGGNVWICGGSGREVLDINGSYSRNLCALKNLLFQSVNSGKRSVIWTLFSLFYVMVKLAYLSDFSLYVKSTVISQIVSFSLPFTSINPFYICFDLLWSLYSIVKWKVWIQTSGFTSSDVIFFFSPHGKLIQNFSWQRWRHIVQPQKTKLS